MKKDTKYKLSVIVIVASIVIGVLLTAIIFNSNEILGNFLIAVPIFIVFLILLPLFKEPKQKGQLK